MPRVLICHDAPDRSATLIAWLHTVLVDPATAPAGGIVIFAPEAAASRHIDQYLWSTPVTSFIPHCHSSSALAAETPLLIADRLDQLARRQKLINFSDDIPPGYEQFDELIEIVTQAESVRNPARQRARHYRDQGYEVHFRDLRKDPL
jgi:DNA polymerase-3 subunit chi